MIALETVTITQLTVDGGDMAAQQLGDLLLAVTGPEQRFKLYAPVMIEPFPSCHFQILQNQITQMTARLDSCYAGALTVRRSARISHRDYAFKHIGSAKEGNQKRPAEGSGVPAGRERASKAKGAGSREAAHIRAAHALSYFLTMSVIRAAAIAEYPL